MTTNTIPTTTIRGAHRAEAPLSMPFVQHVPSSPPLVDETARKNYSLWLSQYTMNRIVDLLNSGSLDPSLLLQVAIPGNCSLALPNTTTQMTK